MDHEITRLVLALVLTGLVLFVWNYYRTAFHGKPSESVPWRSHEAPEAAGFTAGMVKSVSLR